MPVLAESPFYTMLPRAAFYGQNHMRARCSRPVFMYMSRLAVHEQGRVPMPVLPESHDRAFFLDLGIWYLFISHHSHMTIRHETQTLLHDCISHDRAFFHDLGICYLFNSHHWGLDISLVHDLGKSQ